jgi:choline dehydrogenase
MASYEYIVVGGGSAGCVVAGELATVGASVLLLEAGDRAEQNPETLRADGYKDAFVNDRVIEERFSTEQPGCDGRAIFVGTGRGMGGSGSVNAMVYTRGSAADFDAFPRGWRWRDLAPDFEALERTLRPRPREGGVFTEACIEAAIEAGFRRSEDLNDGDLSGVLGYEAMNYEGEDRRSSYVAFVKDRGPLPNLTVATGARAHRLLVQDGRVTGVAYEHEGAHFTATATREVVLTAGALETPRLLLLSGIGPGHALRRAGVPVAADVRGVGENLHDHPNVPVFLLGRRPVDCNYPAVYGFHRALAARDELAPRQSDTCYVFYPARSSLKQATKRMLPAIALPPTWYKRGGAAIRGALDVVFATRLADPVIDRVYGIVVILGKPRSRGSVTLRSPSPTAPALVNPAYLSDPADMSALIEGVRLARRVASGAPLARLGNAELSPGRWVQDDAKIAAWVRKNVISTFHFAGTCRMGDDAGSVVDTRLRLRGVRGLRVADASVIPETPVSALNAPSMVIGLRAARYLREDASALG